MNLYALMDGILKFSLEKYTLIGELFPVIKITLIQDAVHSWKEKK